MGSIGFPELLVIFMVILLLFGSKQLPELARGLGKAMREFKKAANDLQREIDVEDIEKDFKKDVNNLKNIHRSK